MQDASRSLSPVLLSPSRPPAQAPHSELIFLFVCINTALTLASASPDPSPHVRPVLPPASLSLDLFTLDLLLLFLQITLQIPPWCRPTGRLRRRGSNVAATARPHVPPLRPLRLQVRLETVQRAPFPVAGTRFASSASFVKGDEQTGEKARSLLRYALPSPAPRKSSAPSSSLPVSRTLFSQAATLILTPSSLFPKFSPPVRPFSLSSATYAFQESSLALPYGLVLVPGPITLPHLTYEVLTSCALP